jgi:hypothetical protein
MGSTKQANLIVGLASLGFAAGIWYAYKHDKKFWGYVGFALLGNIAGMATGQILSSVIFKQ